MIWFLCTIFLSMTVARGQQGVHVHQQRQSEASAVASIEEMTAHVSTVSKNQEELLWFQDSWSHQEDNSTEDNLFSPRAILHLSHTLIHHVHHHVSTRHHRGLNAVEELCQVIARSFAPELSCQCAGALHSRTFSLICQYPEPICNDQQTCGRPEIALSMAEGQLFSFTTCVVDYENKQRNVAYRDTCMFVQICHDVQDSNSTLNSNLLASQPGQPALNLCGCTLLYGTEKCSSCNLCQTSNGTTGMSLDCSNVNAEAIQETCQELDVDLDLANGAGLVAQFMPSFHGFCSQLEEGVNDRISCDCTSYSGVSTEDAFAATVDDPASYQVTCETKESTCIQLDNTEQEGDAFSACGKVSSSLQIRQGKIEALTSCIELDQSQAWQEAMCTSFKLCSEQDDSLGDVCGCVATFGGIPCTSCEMCQDGQSVLVDCSNVEPHAVMDKCQEVNRSTSFEFIPRFNFASRSPTTTATSGSSSRTVSCLSNLIWGLLLVAVAHRLWV